MRRALRGRTMTRALLPAIETTPCRGLSREQAARYIGVSPTKFDELVKDGSMPLPRRIGTRKIWDVREIDVHFEDIPRDRVPIGSSWEDR